MPTSSNVVFSTAILTNPTAAQTVAGFDLKLATANLIVDSARSVQFGSSGVATPDTGMSRLAAHSFAFGTSAQADTTGILTFTTLNLLGLVAKYNNIATVSNGVPAEYATVDLTAQTAAINTTTLYAVPASGAGQYRVSWNAKITTAAGVSSTLGALTVVYTDPDGVVQTITAGAQTNAGAVATTSTGNSTTTLLLGLPMMLNCKASTNITYAMAYASNAANAMAYNLHIKLEAQ